MHEANTQTIYLKDYQPPEYLIRTVNLNFILDADDTRVVANLTLIRNPDSLTSTESLTLLGETLIFRSVVVDDMTLSEDDYQLDDEKLLLHSVPQNRVFSVGIENYVNPKANTALKGLYLSKGMFCSQCEAEGFRKITYFLDRPDVMARFTTTIIGDRDLYPVMLSNGNKIAYGQLKNNRHWVTWEDPFNKPCYLFALVAGQLQVIKDNFITQSGRNIALEIFVEADDVDKCTHAMQSLQHAMRWDEQAYGREYDLDLYMIVAVSHFNMGAMENKGLNVFNTKFVLARPDTATDSDYEHIEGVIAHEYFHNWTGNRITCRDWFQLSLKEGLTVFRDQEFTADHGSRAVKRIEDVNMLRTNQFAEDAGPLAHPIRPDSYIEINNFYTLTVYEKGAEVVRMIHTLVGIEGFRLGTDLYFQRHDGQAVTCDDFVGAMEVANAIDLAQFRLWYSQAGTPTLAVKTHYDETTKTVTIDCLQSSPATPGQTQKKALHIPVRIGFLAADGAVYPFTFEGQEKLDEMVLQVTEPRQSFQFSGFSDTPVISFLRGFSAPVKLDYQRSLEELAFLASHDSDTFNRWEAGQQLAVSVILDLILDYQAERTLVLKPIMVSAYKTLLTQVWDDLSYLSLLMTLPTEKYLAEQMSVIDVEAIHHTVEFVKQTLATSLQEDFWRLYRDNNREESGNFNNDAIGRRRLKNICLVYLIVLDDTSSYQCAEQQFNAAKNMTDQVAALAVIVNSKHPARQQCLDSFYQRWHEQALVIDKWFTLQASCVLDNAFDDIIALIQHPAFDLTNPNRVRSLIGAFSQANPLHFHAKSGRGYQFLAQQIICLNKINPQIAARLTGALTQWRRFDATQQQLMKQQLEKIINSPNIAKDVYEVVSKSLLVTT